MPWWLWSKAHHRGAWGVLLLGWSSSQSIRGLLEVTRGMRFMPVFPFAAIRQYSSLKVMLLSCIVNSSPGLRAASKST